MKAAQIRFWEKVQFGEGCWEWLGGRRNGYGRFWVKGMRSAHRLAYMFYFGPIPKGLLVRHMCHNPGCVRYDHLQLGTQFDNMQDCVKAGRKSSGPLHSARVKATIRRGEKHPRTHLTDAMVREIKRLRAKGWENKVLAQRFNVNVRVISKINTGKCWGHIT